MEETPILKYIEDSRVSGLSDGEIRSSLLKTGWPEADVNSAFSQSLPSVDVGTTGRFFSRKGIILGIAVFLVCAGGAFGAWTYYKMPYSAFFGIGVDAEKVESFSYDLNLHLKSLEADAKTSVESGIISSTPSHDLIRGADIKLNFNGAYENKNNLPRFSVALDSGIEASKTTLNFDGEVLSISNLLYFRLNEVSETFKNIPKIAIIETGKWYSLMEASFNNLGFRFLESKSPSSDILEYKDGLIDIPVDQKMFELISSERGKLEDGTPVFKYKVKLRKDSLGFYLNEIFKITDKELFSVNRNDEMLDELAESLADKEISISIERDTKYVREVAISIPEINIDGEKFSGEFTLKLSGHNNSSVKIPSPVIQFDPILKKSAEVEKIKSRDTRRIEDLEQIKLALGSYYGANKKKYPASLSVMSPNIMQTVPVDPLASSPYFYFKTTKGYHIGANLEVKDSEVLLNDSDGKAGFSGTDDQGCASEKDRYCYDIAI